MDPVETQDNHQKKTVENTSIIHENELSQTNEKIQVKRSDSKAKGQDQKRAMEVELIPSSPNMDQEYKYDFEFEYDEYEHLDGRSYSGNFGNLDNAMEANLDQYFESQQYKNYSKAIGNIDLYERFAGENRCSIYSRSS